MNIGEAITADHSIKSFTSEKPNKEVVLRVLRAGYQAPSFGSNQHGYFVAIDDEARNLIACFFVSSQQRR